MPDEKVWVCFAPDVESLPPAEQRLLAGHINRFVTSLRSDKPLQLVACEQHDWEAANRRAQRAIRFCVKQLGLRATFSGYEMRGHRSVIRIMDDDGLARGLFVFERRAGSFGIRHISLLGPLDDTTHITSRQQFDDWLERLHGSTLRPVS